MGTLTVLNRLSTITIRAGRVRPPQAAHRTRTGRGFRRSPRTSALFKSSASSVSSCPHGSTAEPAQTPGVASHLSCLSLWTPAAPSSSTSIRAMRPRRCPVPRTTWIAASGRYSGRGADPSRSGRSPARRRSWSGPGRSFTAMSGCSGSNDGLQAAMKRTVSKKKKAHEVPGQGPIHSSRAWQTVRPSGAHFR